jgi:hypothetical protein
VARWPKSNSERTRVVGMPSSDGYDAFVPVVLGNRASPFMVAAGLQRSFYPSGYLV